MNLSTIVKDRIANVPGRIGIYYCNLNKNESFFVGNTQVFRSLGIAKLVMMVGVFDQVEKGNIKFSDKFVLGDNKELFTAENEYEQTVGILDFLHKGVKLTIKDLVNMMTIISDNAAFNALYSIIGKDRVNKTMEDLGLVHTRIEYMLSESEKENPEKDNHHSVVEIGWLLKMMFKGQLISQEASEEMIKLLSYHQRRNVFNHYFNMGTSVMQQTGFDIDCMHDMAIVVDKEPFILCMSFDDLEAKVSENVMRDISLICGIERRSKNRT